MVASRSAHAAPCCAFSLHVLKSARAAADVPSLLCSASAYSTCAAFSDWLDTAIKVIQSVDDADAIAAAVGVCDKSMTQVLT